MKYEDVNICSWDLEFIEDLAESLDLERDEIEFDVECWDVGNQIIDWLYRKYIDSLKIDEDLKDKLISKIYLNYMNSSIDIDFDDFIKENNLQEYSDAIQNLE